MYRRSEAAFAIYARFYSAANSQQDQTLKAYRSEQAKLAKERENIIQAIKDGVPGALVKDDLTSLSARSEELEEILSSAPKSPRPLLHPTMARRYREEVRDLQKSLNDESKRGEAAELLRGLIEKIVLTPVAGEKELSLDLYGDLAGILRAASKENSMKKFAPKEKRPGQIAVNDNYPPKSLALVAGAGFEPTTFGL